MKIYLINLDRRADRLRSMQVMFDAFGLSFVRVPAVDGMQFAKTLPEWTYSLTPAEIGCFLSHKRCFELIAAGEDDYGVVLEDDAELSEGARQYLATQSWIPEAADIIKFETCDARVRLNHIISIPEGNMRLGRLLSSHLGAAGYIVSRNAAKLILPLLEHTKEPIDDFLFTPGRGILNSMVVYQTVPAFCRQSGVTSTINTDRTVWLSERKRIRKQAEGQRKFFSVIVRETLRPIKHLIRFILIKWNAMRTYVNVGQHWQKIPFK